MRTTASPNKLFAMPTKTELATLLGHPPDAAPCFVKSFRLTPRAPDDRSNQGHTLHGRGMATMNYIKDKSGSRVGSVDGDQIKDKAGNRVGSIDSAQVKDKTGNRVGSVDGGNVKDRSGSRVGSIDGGQVKDKSGNRIGSFEGGLHTGVGAAGLLLLL